MTKLVQPGLFQTFKKNYLENEALRCGISPNQYLNYFLAMKICRP